MLKNRGAGTDLLRYANTNEVEELPVGSCFQSLRPPNSDESLAASIQTINSSDASSQERTRTTGSTFTL